MEGRVEEVQLETPPNGAGTVGPNTPDHHHDHAKDNNSSPSISISRPQSKSIASPSSSRYNNNNNNNDDDDSVSRLAAREAQPGSAQPSDTAAAARAQKPLKPGWKEYFDQRTRRYYYYNGQTHETTWRRPVVSTETALSAHSASTSSSSKVGTEANEGTSGLLDPSTKAHDDAAKRRSANRRHSGVFSTINSHHMSTDRFSVHLLRPEQRTHVTQEHVRRVDPTRNLTSYAANNFQRHKRGLFRKPVSSEKIVQWQREPLMYPLHKITKEELIKEITRIFKLIQEYMQDRVPSNSKNVQDPLTIAKNILKVALKEVPIRNEIVSLVAKQCNHNPKQSSLVKGLQLLIVVVSCFPPIDKHLQDACHCLLQSLEAEFPKTDISIYCGVALQRLRRAVVTGPRKTMPSDEEIMRFTLPQISKPVFGVSLEEYLDFQRRDMPSANPNVPRVLEILVEKLIELNGLHTEGIFRLPGDTKQVETLKDRFSNGDFTVETKDPHVCASACKLWLRELESPLIPDHLYSTCLKSSSNPEECMRLLNELPDMNRSVMEYILKFLHSMTPEEISKDTKMGAENLAVVFCPNFLRSQATDPKVIMAQASLEQQFVVNLIKHFK